jgi:hypothetical protein
MDNFVDSPKDRKKIIILLTDGVYNKWIDPILAAKKAKEEGVIIHTIWIWKEKEISIPEIRKVVDGIDIDGLKSLSSIWWWNFYNATNEKELLKIFDDLAKLEKTPIEYEIYSNNKTNYRIFVYVLVLLFISFFALDLYYNKHS